MNIPTYVQDVLMDLTRAGFECYLVGGCVRDMLLKKEPSDYDVCTSALPEEILEVFKKDKTIKTGLAHGTVTVLKYGTPVEVTTFRIDGNYRDGRHPDSVKFSSSIKEDLSRRDFTINAMAYNNRLIDPFGGKKDLENKMIRCAGKGELRFREDALRILRGMRFSATLGFEVEGDTKVAMINNANRLSMISPERKTEELIKLLLAKEIYFVLIDFRDVFKLVLYGDKSRNDFVWDDLAHAANSCNDVVTRLAILYYPSRDGLSTLKLSKALYNKISLILDNMNYKIQHNAESIKYALKKFGEQGVLDLLAVRIALKKIDSKTLDLAKQIIRDGECYSLKALAIKGRDIKAMYPQLTKEIGEVLDQCVDGVILGKINNNRDELIKFVNKAIEKMTKKC